MYKKQSEKVLSKSPSKNQYQEFAGKRTLNRETRDGACGELREQYAEILPDLSNQIKKIGNLTKEIISSLKKLNLEEIEEKKESSMDNSVITLTGGIEELQNIQGSMKDLIIKLEKHNAKIKQELQKEAVFVGIEKDLQDVKNKKTEKLKQASTKSEQDVSSYQQLNKKLQDKDTISKKTKPNNRKKTNGDETIRRLQAELDAKSRNTLPEGLDIGLDFEVVKKNWEQRVKISNAKKLQDKEENLGEENFEKNTPKYE